MRVNFTAVFCLAGILLFFQSCVKKSDFDNYTYTDYTPSIALPVINSQLSMADVVAKTDKKGVLIVNANGYYTFYYRDTTVSPTAEVLFPIESQSFNTGTSLTASDIAPQSFGVALPAGLVFSKTLSTNFFFNFGAGNQMNEVDLKSGSLAFKLASTFQHKVNVTLTFTNLLLNGAPLVKSYTLDYANNTFSVSDSISLDGYELAFSTPNTLSVTAAYTITTYNNPILSTDNISASVNFNNPGFSKMVGTFSSFPSPLSQNVTTDINIFTNAIFGDVVFTNPQIQQWYDNSIGIPFNYAISSLTSVTAYGTNVILNCPSVIGQTFPLAYPTISDIGQTMRTYLLGQNQSINTSNTIAPNDIVKFFNPAPKYVQTDFNVNLASSTGQSFILDTSRVKVYTLVTLPLQGRIAVYDMRDTIKDITLPGRQYIDSITFNIYANNGLPTDVFLQVYCLDSSGAVLDSLLPPNPQTRIIQTAQVDANGNVTAPTIANKVIEIDKARYSVIYKTKTLVLKGSMISANSGNTIIEIAPQQMIDLKISVEAATRFAIK